MNVGKEACLWCASTGAVVRESADRENGMETNGEPGSRGPSGDELVRAVGECLVKQGISLTTAESCTGGGIAQMVTSQAGSSCWFDRAFVTYRDESKEEMVDVSAHTLRRCGAVSEEVVREMAAGALRKSRAGIAVAVSGIAGPGGGSEEKPVGTVCFAWALRGGGNFEETLRFAGDREAVRAGTICHALAGLLRLAELHGIASPPDQEE